MPENVRFRAVRIGVTPEMRLRGLDPTENIAIALLDISEGGLRMVSAIPLEKKDRVRITFKDPGAKLEISASAVIRWVGKVRPGPETGYEVGAEFVDLRGEDRIRLREYRCGRSF